MAFGITRKQLNLWKKQVKSGEIAFLTHYWQDPRFPNYYTVTKVGCINIIKLSNWGKQYGLDEKWIHYNKKYPHFDLLGDRQKTILKQEGLEDQIRRFNLDDTTIN